MVKRIKLNIDAAIISTSKRVQIAKKQIRKLLKVKDKSAVINFKEEDWD